MLSQSDTLAKLIDVDETYVYICGLKGTEQGVEAEFEKICTDHRLDWSTLKTKMQQSGRYHVETYY